MVFTPFIIFDFLHHNFKPQLIARAFFQNHFSGLSSILHWTNALASKELTSKAAHSSWPQKRKAGIRWDFSHFLRNLKKVQTIWQIPITVSTWKKAPQQAPICQLYYAFNNICPPRNQLVELKQWDSTIIDYNKLHQQPWHIMGKNIFPQ